MKSRILYTKRNIVYALLSQIIAQLANFVVRTVFIKELDAVYLGVNGLFSNILTYLSLAELGVGSALIYSMYAPLAKGDTDKVSAYMNTYQKCYLVIGAFVLAIGCSLTPFLDFFINGESNIPNLRLIYVLYVLNTASSYFFAYKGSIFRADQKQYIVTNNNTLFVIMHSVFRILILRVFHSFILYLIITIVCNLLENIVIALKANRAYPYLKQNKNSKLEKNESIALLKNVSAMFLHKVSDVVLGSTDNIIMSKFIGLLTVGLYSNYQMIINVVKTVFNLVAGGIVPSVGNLCASESKEKQYEVFKSILLLNIWVVAFCCICLLNLLTPFVELWIGENYVIHDRLIMWIVMSLYIQLSMRAIEMFRTATGMFWNDRYFAILQCAINIVVSIVLVKVVGCEGIFIGTAVAVLATKFWKTSSLIYRNAFNKNPAKYFLTYSIYTTVGIIAAVITRYICSFATDGINGFVFRTVVCLVIPNICYLIVFFKTREFRYLLSKVVTRMVRN